MQKVKLYFALAIVFVLIAVVSAFAQVPTAVDQNCVFTWDAYTDPTAASLKMYLNKDGVQMAPVVNIPKSATSYTCKDAGVTSNGLYKANLHAVDATGLESDPSNGLTFQVTVKIKPKTPSNFAVK